MDPLKGFGSSDFMIGNSTGNTLIKAACVNGGFQLNVARLQILLVKLLGC